MQEADHIAALRALATDPIARGLNDDAALIAPERLAEARNGLVLTHDTLVEGVHYLPDDPPESVGWKLVAVNVSDLAAKGATPWLALASIALTARAQWNHGFLGGMADALRAFDIALVGGDTVSCGHGPGTVGLTLLGRAGRKTPGRDGAKPGDGVFLTGKVGAAGVGLAVLQGRAAWDKDAVSAYRRPQPRLREGLALAPLASAMMDVSDGLLIDSIKLADASGVTVAIDLDLVPVHGACDAAIVAGDDYELLATLPTGVGLPAGIGLYRIGSCLARSAAGPLVLTHGGQPCALPERTGYTHGADDS